MADNSANPAPTQAPTRCPLCAFDHPIDVACGLAALFRLEEARLERVNDAVDRLERPLRWPGYL